MTTTQTARDHKTCDAQYSSVAGTPTAEGRTGPATQMSCALGTQLPGDQNTSVSHSAVVAGITS